MIMIFFFMIVRVCSLRRSELQPYFYSIFLSIRQEEI